MISKIINTTFKRYFMNTPVTTLGRWGIECDNGKKILTDYANVDHCGPCGFDEYRNVEKRYQEIDNNIKFYKEKQEKQEKNI